ncbi:hypothetical protein AA103581_2273 [Gluconobacter wancherniae NBRC 103581]|nr:hypothetical protein AA103581_2273 [Gluconobacter wancherniae NBRC 103581]
MCDAFQIGRDSFFGIQRSRNHTPDHSRSRNKNNCNEWGQQASQEPNQAKSRRRTPD